MLPTNKQVTDTLLAQWPKGTPRTKQMRIDADKLLTERYNITAEEKAIKYGSGTCVYSALLGGALAHIYGNRVDRPTTDAAQDDVESVIEIEEVRQYSEFALRDNPELEKALLRIGIRKVSTEYSVPDFGRIDIAGSEVATGEFTSVELKVVEAGSKEAAQACKYRAFQERMKGTGKSGRVVLIAPSFNITFWAVAARFPEIQAFSYTQDATEAIALTRESNG